MKQITCLIVEDEPVSQEILKKYISDYSPLDLVGVCENAVDAIEAVRKFKPHVIFLDITLPKISGLDFYRSLVDPPYVIFTTAYPEYAVNGFEVDAIDYLVKPFPFDRFLRAVTKLQSKFTTSDVPDAGFIMLQADKKMHKVSFTDIQYAEAMGDYVKVFLAGKMLVVHMTVQKLIDQLPPALFMRVHKSFVVALAKIDYIEGNMVVIGANKIPIGQTFRNSFLDALNKR